MRTRLLLTLGAMFLITMTLTRTTLPTRAPILSLVVMTAWRWMFRMVGVGLTGLTSSWTAAVIFRSAVAPEEARFFIRPVRLEVPTGQL